MLTGQSFFAVVLATIATLSATTSGRVIDAAEKRQDGSKWVTTWTSMPQLVESGNMPPSQFVSFGTPRLSSGSSIDFRTELWVSS
jgi:hypothetical protein